MVVQCQQIIATIRAHRDNSRHGQQPVLTHLSTTIIRRRLHRLHAKDQFVDYDLLLAPMVVNVQTDLLIIISCHHRLDRRHQVQKRCRLLTKIVEQ
jgi:hypothetical protein